MDQAFDFRLHQRSTIKGTQYFELLPGRLLGEHWNPQSRFIDEYTFCLIEGVFEKLVPGYDHFAFDELSRPAWNSILAELASLRTTLEHPNRSAPVALPYGSYLTVQPDFERSWRTNERQLAGLLMELDQWLRQVLQTHEVVSLLGL